LLDPADNSLVERDSQIAGLRILLQPERLVAALQGRVEPGLLLDARVTYLRYKPGVSCIARIETMGHFAYAKAHGDQTLSKLEKARQRSAMPGPWGAGTAILDKEGILFAWMPCDAKLKSLARMFQPGEREALLNRMFNGQAGWAQSEFTVLNYKPERRCVGKLTRPDGKAATAKFFSKLEFDAILRSRKELVPPSGVILPDWIGGSNGMRAMAFAWLKGETLDHLLAAGEFDKAALAGEVIARLHASPQANLDEGEKRAPPVVLKALSRHLGHLLPACAERAAEISRQISEWLGRRVVEKVPVHGDFYDRQVVVNGNQVGLIDSDSVGVGDRIGDLGCFIAHLERCVVDDVLDRGDMQRVRTAFLMGYANGPFDLDERELDGETAHQLFRLIHQPFRDRRPNWADQTAILLDRCAALMATA